MKSDVWIKFPPNRNGVPDRQIEHEVAAIEACLAQEGLVQEPFKFTYIIVTKKNNTRFFNAGPKPSNPPSGTVVDDVVTFPKR